ncbi:MAG: non-hydrolyzing UDP-N-acetylglucosamine 2-epimerase [Nitrosopumilaceae archaeon]
MKVALIVGTRPQIIKSQPLIKEIISRKSKVSIIHTGQHYDYEMSKTFFNELKIKNPDFNLGVSKGSSSKQLGEIISKLEKPLKKINPDVVVVPGDTRSALGAALSANRLSIPLAHLESGARSYDNKMEEEINRRLIDHCSDLLFTPTMNCFKNLKKESVLGKIFFTGDTMYDVFLQYKKILKIGTNKERNYILMTIHRRENILNIPKLKQILYLTKNISNQGYKIIFPLHPHTKRQIKSNNFSLKGIDIIEPVKYSKMLTMLSQAKLLLTDSGGLQKEAFWSNTPCVTIRDNTEWIETLMGNHNALLRNVKSSDSKKILKILKFNPPKKISTPKTFGDGRASKKITSILLKQF